MASELSKLIEDQLQKHDEEAPMSPTEKQRLLSSSLRIKVCRMAIPSATLSHETSMITLNHCGLQTTTTNV